MKHLQNPSKIEINEKTYLIHPLPPFNPSFLLAQTIPSSDILQNGYAAITHLAKEDSSPSLTILDINSIGSLHDSVSNHGAIDHSLSTTKTQTFNRSLFDDYEIMCLTFDKYTGEIYVATSRLYINQVIDIPPIIFKISADGLTVDKLATLPGELGIGWIDIDDKNKIIYASNMDNGLIYSIDISNGLNQTTGFQTFSPFSPDLIDGKFLELGKRIFGVGYNHIEERLYYSIWAENKDAASATEKNSIRSIKVDQDGNFDISSDTKHFDVLDNTVNDAYLPYSYNFNSPVSDIEFSKDGSKMLLAQQGFSGEIPVSRSHSSIVLEYNGSSTLWTPEAADKHLVGYFELTMAKSKANSRGGVDFGYHDISNYKVNGFEEYIYSTGDSLPSTPDPKIGIFGLQFNPISGGDYLSSINIDLGINAPDSDSANRDTYIYSDIDIRVHYIKTIGDKLWLDFNKNGIQDSEDTPLIGVTVNLYDSSLDLIDSVLTDVNGEYSFDVQADQLLYIKIDNPNDYLPLNPLENLILTSIDFGSDDLIDSDAEILDQYPTITYENLEIVDDLSLDFGFIDDYRPEVDIISSKISLLNLKLANRIKKSCNIKPKNLKKKIKNSKKIYEKIWQTVWTDVKINKDKDCNF